MDIRYDAETLGAESFDAEETCPMCKKDNPIIGGEVCAECTQYLEDEQDRFSQRYGAETFSAPSCKGCERFDRSVWDSNRCATCGEMRKGMIMGLNPFPQKHS